MGWGSRVAFSGGRWGYVAGEVGAGSGAVARAAWAGAGVDPNKADRPNRLMKTTRKSGGTKLINQRNDNLRIEF